MDNVNLDGKPKEYYTEQLNNYKNLLVLELKKSAWFSVLRLIFFIGALSLSVLMVLKSSFPFIFLTIVCGFLGMIILVKYHLHIQKKIRSLKNLIHINETEINCLNYHYENQPNGEREIDFHHPFAADLDIFGNDSLFQFLNRTTTPFGTWALISAFKSPELNQQRIKENQECIRELSGYPQWRQQFQDEGMNLPVDSGQMDQLFRWVNDEASIFLGKRIFYFYCFLILITLISLVYGILTSTYGLFIGLVISQLMIMARYTKKINSIHRQVSQMHEALQSYSALFKLIQNQKFDFVILKNKQEQFGSILNGASGQIKKLSSILNAFDYRLNILVGMVLNSMVMFDIFSVYRLEKWKQKNKETCEGWFKGLGEFEKLNSLANFAFNHPDYSYPALKKDLFYFKAQSLGHPLIPDSKRVCNDFELQRQGNLSILTGANMAGKSTFLRTVGINLVLGMTGAPVCAANFEFSPIALWTSINVRDSLKGNESYFYAELQRLKSIIDQLNEGQSLFIILDEILKGTNSKDKLKGSISLLERLKDMNVMGIIATHDISLSELELQYPDKFKNFCFEVSLDNDFLYYDYTLQQGVCKNLNALLLMKKMGLVD